MAPDDEIKNGRFTTREFYDAVLDQNKSRGEMEQRIVKKMDGLATKKDVDKIDKRLTYQERKSNVQDALVAIFAGLAVWLFGKQ